MCGISACLSLAPPSNGYAEHAGVACNAETESGSTTNRVRHPLATQLQASLNVIAHRGPDDSGVWINESEEVGLGHCRLSINDLSSAGRQPLHSTDGHIHVVVNGEIYDYDRLRHKCETAHHYVFQSDSDSELVLALYQIFGAPGFFAHLRGEFAFVLYDDRPDLRRLIAARDRYGIKPLVYTRVGSSLLIASEAKAFLPFGWRPRWDVCAIANAGWMFDDRTLFRGVRKVLPGHYLETTEDGGVRQVQYWDAEYEDKRKPEIRSMGEMVAGVRERLVESVRLRLRADVPVGIYLSGASTRPPSRGSVAFPEISGYDESQIAERTAEWLGVKTIKRTITEETLAENFEDAVFHCEHHHFDLNFVVLTGEGADEHFAGYPYFFSEFLREADEALPDSHLSQNSPLRSEMFESAQREMKGIWQKGGATAYENRSALPSIAGPGAADMSDNLLAWHPSATLFASWVQARQGSDDCRRTVLNSYPKTVQAKMRSRWHPLHTSMYMWNKNSLANVLLSCLGDRTEMAHSVEARTPYLDHHLTEYINRLPPSAKLRYTAETASASGELGPIWTKSSVALQSLNEKWILREAVRPYILDELYRRKKHPFLAPTRWGKDGPLYRKLKALLTRDAVEVLGFVSWTAIQEAMEIAWGEYADTKAFRLLLYCGAWVTISQRIGVARADEADWDPSTL
ncbi:glutamine-hydrolyzing asparagine synthase [Penicillium chermesinum]|uniref:Glutamine-hydrolyzing asparagine synthase n=1 Tax=Penicillium chermesinum TaxID=63820 RepID=A0A9W9N879_9EURO|nr:glutamine-hydrolyzing asparagine synthase [Penicillium chermesinum]KAJ5215068.1 glutamine-hydrolyzing asparagine synthase [Penicillium chermesinum]